MKPRMSARKVAVLAAGLAAAAIAVPLSVGSSHREAPNIALDPAADNTDVYAFTAADAPDALTIVSNWIPGQVPANGPNFFRFDDRARYYVNIDNKGDGKPNARYLFRFNTTLNNPDSFLYAGPGTQDFNDPGLNVEQRYRVTHETLNKNGKVIDRKTLAKNLPVAPSNIGPKTFPSYQSFVGAATKTALGVFAPMSILSMAGFTAGFAWLLTRPIIEPVYRRVLIPALGGFGVFFGLWYAGLA